MIQIFTLNTTKIIQFNEESYFKKRKKNTFVSTS